MPMGINQNNNLLYQTLDVWQDNVFFREQVYPAGYFACGIMNIQMTEIKALSEKGGAVMQYGQRLYAARKQELRAILPEAKAAVTSLLDSLWQFPPFSLMDKSSELSALDILFSDASVNDISNPASPVREFFFRYLDTAASIPIGIYNFVCAAWFLEQDYLRRLKKRDETHFAVGAHDCFNSELFQKEMRELNTSGREAFTVSPPLRSSYVFARSPKNEKKMVFVNRVFFDSAIHFYTYDLMNGLHYGHAPSRCLGCEKYFLTTNAHTPKYCEGIAPQDVRYTCRQYGALMRQKEQNKNHPVYALFKTRTNTIRKHQEREKISPALREAAITLAETYRDKALFDDAYAKTGYARDMELSALYAEAERRMAE